MKDMKICSGCKNLLLLSLFSKERETRDGLRYECKDCRKKASHIYYLKNKKRIRAKINQYRKKYPEKRNIMEKRRYTKERLLVLIHYGGSPPKCACPPCGETEIKFLTIDHVNNDGGEHRKILRSLGSNLTRWLIKNGYPKGYQVLCFNCNCGRARNNGICPHKEEDE